MFVNAKNSHIAQMKVIRIQLFLPFFLQFPILFKKIWSKTLLINKFISTRSVSSRKFSNINEKFSHWFSPGSITCHVLFFPTNNASHPVSPLRLFVHLSFRIRFYFLYASFFHFHRFDILCSYFSSMICM